MHSFFGMGVRRTFHGPFLFYRNRSLALSTNVEGPTSSSDSEQNPNQLSLSVSCFPIFKKIPGSIWFPRYRYDQLMGLGRKVFLPLSLARVVPVSGVLVTFQWLP